MTRLLRTIMFGRILALPIATDAAPSIWGSDFGASNVTGALKS